MTFVKPMKELGIEELTIISNKENDKLRDLIERLAMK